MVEEQQAVSESPATAATAAETVGKDVVEEKTPPKSEADTPAAAVDESKALVVIDTDRKEEKLDAEKKEEKKEAIVESIAEGKDKNVEGGSANRDAVLVKVNTEKRAALVKAWEENEKAKAENKYFKAVSNISAWENTQKSSAETRLRKKEEKLEKMKAAYVEKMKNEIAIVHRKAEENKALAEAKKGEELLKAEESAAKFRASGELPKKFCMCFGA